MLLTPPLNVFDFLFQRFLIVEAVKFLCSLSWIQMKKKVREEKVFILSELTHSFRVYFFFIQQHQLRAMKIIFDVIIPSICYTNAHCNQNTIFHFLLHPTPPPLTFAFFLFPFILVKGWQRDQLNNPFRRGKKYFRRHILALKSLFQDFSLSRWNNKNLIAKKYVHLILFNDFSSLLNDTKMRTERGREWKCFSTNGNDYE